MSLEHQCIGMMLLLALAGFCTGACVGIVIGIKTVEKEIRKAYEQQKQDEQRN